MHGYDKQDLSYKDLSYDMILYIYSYAPISEKTLHETILRRYGITKDIADNVGRALKSYIIQMKDDDILKNRSHRSLECYIIHTYFQTLIDIHKKSGQSSRSVMQIIKNIIIHKHIIPYIAIYIRHVNPLFYTRYTDYKDVYNRIKDIKNISDYKTYNIINKTKLSPYDIHDIEAYPYIIHKVNSMINSIYNKMEQYKSYESTALLTVPPILIILYIIYITDPYNSTLSCYKVNPSSSENGSAYICINKDLTLFRWFLSLIPGILWVTYIGHKIIENEIYNHKIDHAIRETKKALYNNAYKLVDHKIKVYKNNDKTTT
jgi:hypothetical protein